MNNSWFRFSVHPAFRKASPDADMKPMHQSLEEIGPADTKGYHAARARYIADATRKRIALVEEPLFRYSAELKNEKKPAGVQGQGPQPSEPLPILVHHVQEHAAAQGLRPSELLPKIAKHLDVPEDQVLRNLDGNTEIPGLPDQLTNLKGNDAHREKIKTLYAHLYNDPQFTETSSNEDFDKAILRLRYRQFHGVDAYPIDEVPDIATHLLHGPPTLTSEGKSAHARAIGYALAAGSHSDVPFDENHYFSKLISHHTGFNHEEHSHIMSSMTDRNPEKTKALVRQPFGDVNPRSARDWGKFYMMVADKIREACIAKCSPERNGWMRNKTKYEIGYERDMVNATGAFNRDLNRYRGEAGERQHGELQRYRNMLFLPRITKNNPDTGKKWTSADLAEQISSMKHILSSPPNEETIQHALGIANLQNAHPDTWGR